MSEPNNDNLERFFRKAARDPHVAFNESDWRKLEARLDAKAFRASSKRPNRWRSGVASVGIILFFTGITYFLLPDSDQSGLTYSTKNSRVKAIPENKIADMVDSPGKAAPGTVAVQSNQIASVKKNKSNAEIKIFTVDNAPGNSNTGNQDRPDQRIETKKETGESLSRSLPNGIQPQDALENRLTELKVSEGGNGYSPALPLTLREDSINDSLVEKDKPDAGKSEIKANPDSVVKGQVTPAPARWSIVLSFAPDFSSTRSSQYTAPGAAFGLVAHYHLSNSFSVATGIIRSHKQYWSYGSEYQPPKGYWKRNTNGVVPEP